MEELKPCPFCGSNNQTIKNVWQTWRFVACECKAGGVPARDDAGAIKNWNTRAERTCTLITEDGNNTWHLCTACDADFYMGHKPTYCPNCGAKVVNDA